MPSRPRPTTQRLAKTFTLVRTGLFLLLLVGLAAAVGTLVLQRPLTDPAELERVYSPQTLRWLDAFGLTDVFHSWWFVALLGLLSLNILLASLERFPMAWRYFARPYRRAEPHFLAGLRLQQAIAVRSAQSSVETAERAFRRLGLKPHCVGKDGNVSLYAERNRPSRLAPYIVHASLLLILGGGIADAVWGYRGFMTLTQNQQSNQIELRSGTKKALPFIIRCQDAGQENYPDGSPRRWWTQLAVIEDGREVMRKEIEVNDPLVYRGLRFLQSSYGSTGQMKAVMLAALTLLIERRYRVKVIGTVTMPLAVVSVILMQLLPSAVRPLVPALQSTWLHIHVTLAMLAYAACAVSFALALMFLIQDKVRTETFLAGTSAVLVAIYMGIASCLDASGGLRVVAWVQRRARKFSLLKRRP